MLVVNKSEVDIIGNKVTAVASDLGLRPGIWPDWIAIVDDTGSGFLFHKDGPQMRLSELVGYNYKERNRVAEFFIIND